MAQFGLNVSTSQLEKLQKALKTTDASKLEQAQLTGNASSIFNEFNVSSDNIFKDTGLDKILNDIAGEDGQISQNEMQNFLGDDVFSMESFLSVVENAVEDSLKSIQGGSTASSSATSNNHSGSTGANTSSYVKEKGYTASSSVVEEKKSTITSTTKPVTTNNSTSASSTTSVDKNISSTSSTKRSSSTAPSSSTGNKSIDDSLTTPDRNLIHDLESESADNYDLSKAISYQNDGTAREGVYNESKEFIAESVKEIIDNNDCGIEDLVVAGGADFLKNTSEALSGYNIEDFNIDKENISSEFIAILSNAYEKASSEGEVDNNSLLGRLYGQTKDFIKSQTADSAMFEAYSGQMGSKDNQFDDNEVMTLEEMYQNVDRFNEILSIDPDFYDKYAQTGTTKDGTICYSISDAQRAEMITAENKLLGENRKIVEDSDYTMTKPDALTWDSDDSFFEKFGKSTATMAFVADGGWKEYNILNKEYTECQNLQNQFNEQGFVEYEGKRYDASNAQAFVDAMNEKIEEIQKQKDEIERTETFNAVMAETAGEVGWEAAKFGLGIVSGGAVQVTLIAADAAIAAHDTIADGGSWDDALVASIANAAGNVLGNKLGDALFPGANEAAVEVTERATERLTSEATERIATEVAENIAESTARRIAQETGQNITQEASESAIKKIIIEKLKYDSGNQAQSLNEDWVNGIYEAIKAELTGKNADNS